MIIFHPFAETDYKPTANAGSDIVINLPQNYVTLYGNASTDDKGIKSYEWTKAPDGQLAADMMVNLVVSFKLFPLKERTFSRHRSKNRKWIVHFHNDVYIVDKCLCFSLFDFVLMYLLI